MLLLFALIVGSSSVWGQTTVTFDATTDITANAQSYQSTELTINAADGSTWKANGYGATANTNIIIGKGGANYLETPNVNGTITSVAVTWSGNTSYYLALQTTTGTELGAKSNPSESTTETFTVSGSYSQLRLVGRRASGTSNAAATITKVVVTYVTGGSQDNRAETTTTINVPQDFVTDLAGGTDVAAGTLTATVRALETVVSNAAVTWTSSEETVATIDANGAVILKSAGTTTITAAYAGDETDYKPSYGTYDLTVTNSTPNVQPTAFDIYLNDAFFGTNYNGTASGITDANSVSGSLHNVNVTYAGSGNHYINDSQIRFYPSNKLTFEAPTGYNITKIVFTATTGGTWTATISANSGTYTSSEKTWTGEAASVLFTGSGSGRCDISKVSITIAQASSPSPAEGYYVKVTNTDDITDGKYLIVYEEGNLAFDGSLTTLDASGNTIDVTINNNKITATNETEAAEFTIDAFEGTIKSASGYYIGQNSDANGMLSDLSTEYKNTLSVNNGVADIVSSGGAYLRYNATSGQDRFRYFRSSTYTSQKAIQLYKKVVFVTIAQSGYTTLSSTHGLDFTGARTDATNADALIAYIIPRNDGVKLYIETVDEAAAGTGILLKGTGGATYTIPVKADAAAVGTNLLKAGPTEVEEGNQTIYLLKSGQFRLASAGTTSVGKAYLELPTAVGAPSLSIDGDDETTGIQSIDRTINDNQYYTLDGRRVAEPTKGIYIINGKKVVIK